MDISSIIPKSGDSILMATSWNMGILHIELTLGETDERIHLSIATDRVFFSPKVYDSGSDKTCFIEFKLLEEIIPPQNTLYLPPSDFHLLMEQINNQFHIAYGLKKSEYGYFFSLRGYQRLVACVIKNHNDIKVSGI